MVVSSEFSQVWDELIEVVTDDVKAERLQAGEQTRLARQHCTLFFSLNALDTRSLKPLILASPFLFALSLKREYSVTQTVTEKTR